MRTHWLMLTVGAVLVAALVALTYARKGSGATEMLPIQTAAAPHSVKLTWVPSAGATSYNIYRSTVSGVRGANIGISTTPTFLDVPVPSGTTFYYTVTAVGNGAESGPSNEAKAVIP